MECEEWFPGRFFYRADFSALQQTGRFKLAIEREWKRNTTFLTSEIGKRALAAETVPAIIQYYHHQRANSPEELRADQHILLYGSTNRVDLHGGWCDAPGDVSKYFSHLAYANFMSPQQTPMVVWSLVNTMDTAPAILDRMNARKPLMDEAISRRRPLRPAFAVAPWLFLYDSVRAISKKTRRRAGWWACWRTAKQPRIINAPFGREAGMAIAALARISQWKA